MNTTRHPQDDKMAALRTQCAHHTRKTMQQEVNAISNLLPTLQDTNALPDEIIMPLHNIISIAPEEQYRMLGTIKSLYARIPIPIRKQHQDIQQAYNKIMSLTTEQTNTKIQETDLSMYWAAYRRFQYLYGYTDNNKQLFLQKRLQKITLEIALYILHKRKQGIITATKIIGQ